MYSPIVSGSSTAPESSTSSSSIRLRSTTKCRPVTGIGIRVGPRLLAPPDVGPGQPAIGVLLGDEVRAVRPGLDEHAIHVGDPAARQRLDHPRLAAHRLVDLVELVDGHVRLAVGLVPPLEDAVLRERDERPCRPSRHRGSSTPPAPRAGHDAPATIAAHGGLGGLAQFDRRESPAIADLALAPQQRHDATDLVGRERIQRMASHGAAWSTIAARCASAAAAGARGTYAARAAFCNRSTPLVSGSSLRATELMQ